MLRFPEDVYDYFKYRYSRNHEHLLSKSHYSFLANIFNKFHRIVSYEINTTDISLDGVDDLYYKQLAYKRIRMVKNKRIFPWSTYCIYINKDTTTAHKDDTVYCFLVNLYSSGKSYQWRERIRKLNRVKVRDSWKNQVPLILAKEFAGESLNV